MPVCCNAVLVTIHIVCINLALYIYCYEIIVLYLLYLICFFLNKFMYNAFEQALSMKRALYKFGIII